jgi:hypothetical protein
MTGEVRRLLLERVGRAVTLVSLIAGVGIGIEIGLSQTAPDTGPVPRDRASDFLIPTGSSAPADSNHAAIEEALRKPLFIEGRGIDLPQVAATVVSPPQESEPDIRLVGVQLSSDARLALVRLSDGDRTLRAVEGQFIGSWMVTRIFGDHVELTRKSESRSIYLGDARPPGEDGAAGP